jgi:GNAT superfamily N-acetyltransferase
MNRTLPATRMLPTTESRIAVSLEPGLLRGAGPGDADEVSDFVCRLSVRSRYLRFFAAVAPPSASLLRALCGGTGADVLIVTGSDGRVMAHGMAADDHVPGGKGPGDGGFATNIGLMVADEWQTRGLGTLLLATLVARAAGRGARSLVLDVLPENHRMLGIIARRWPDAPRQLTADAIVVRPVITARQAAGGVPVPAVIGLRGQRFSVGSGGDGGAARQPAA